MSPLGHQDVMNGNQLQFDGIVKDFPGVRALDGVSFGVNGGTVHALLGENGAGKSTLLKLLSGDHQPSAGRIALHGRPCFFRRPAEAIAAGVAVIYQELNLVPEMSVMENLLLGQLPHRWGVVRQQECRERVVRELRLLGENLDPAARVKSLPIAQRQMVEITKALMRNAEIIAFDEPTSSLTEQETTRLFAVILDLKRRGKVILYVSHRLPEVFAICDAVTVLRDGKCVRTVDDIHTMTADGLVKLMVGRDIQDIHHYARRPPGAPGLAVQCLRGEGLDAPLELSVSQGEIVGLFGLVGAGRTELLKLLFGAARRRGGNIKIAGADTAIDCPADAIGAGMAFCPEDRKAEGIVPTASVRENINLSARPRFSRFGFLIDEARERANAAEQIRRLAIKTPSQEQKIVHLSGGNQQKAVLARWLAAGMKVLLLDEPTRGIDVGAKSEIYAIIRQLAEDGVALLVVSSDLPEVMGICDRILVMRAGRITAEFSRATATEERLLKAALPAETTPDHSIHAALGMPR
jgi:L-arabinose transport system ATP-binding protein